MPAVMVPMRYDCVFSDAAFPVAMFSKVVHTDAGSVNGLQVSVTTFDSVSLC